MHQGTYVFHEDAGHGWLEVPRAELAELGVLGEVSQFSYQKGDKVYLEEDCDAAVFILTMKNRNIPFKMVNAPFVDESRIRRYTSFRV